MNRRLRVLLFGRHFWPHGSIDSAGYLVGLCNDLARRGLYVEVVTPRYAASWPQRFHYRDVLVHRPVTAPKFGAALGREWSVNRYIRLMANWIREHGQSFDVILVDRAREELVAAVEAAKTMRCATLVRIGQWGRDNDLCWWQTGRPAARCANAARMTDGVIAKNASDHRELIARGMSPDRLFRIDDGFVPGKTRTDNLIIQSRKAIGAVNRDLDAPPDAPVMVCCGAMTSESGVNLVVDSARVLSARYPDLRFWFIGDGPNRDSMYEFLRSEGVRSSIAMPGSFADLDDVFSAADLVVQPGHDGLESVLRSAVSAELPIVSVDTPQTREVLGGTDPISDQMIHGDVVQTTIRHRDTGALVSWFEEDSVKSLRRAVRAIMDNPKQSQENARELRRLLCRHRPRSVTVDAYVRLIERVAARASSGWPSASIETAS